MGWWLRSGKVWIVLAALVVSAPSDAATRALLVGIATYKHAGQGEFKNLKGAGNDVAAMADVLQKKYRLDPASMTTLRDSQATREAILGGLTTLVTASRPSDQIVFYYSGHGALVSEGFGGGGDEADRVDETIVPYDSRGPDGITDIRDDELRRLIDEASRRGVNVITIFDSCNSGSATRGGVRRTNSRAAPPATSSAPLPEPAALPAPTVAAATPGYRIHLASARDGEMAIEAEEGGQWRGDFTDAFVKALYKLPAGAAYKDLLAEVRMQMAEAGLAGQHPRGEGELGRGFLSDRPVDRRIFALNRAAAGWQIDGGTIAGIHPGARFAIFRTAGEAGAASATPISTATVTAADAATARIDGNPAGTGLLYAREIERKFAPAAVRVMVQGTASPARTALETAIASNPTLKQVGADPVLVLTVGAEGVTVDDPDGNRRARFDAGRSAEAVKSIASYFSLLQLRDAGAAPAVDINLDMIRCDSDDSCDSPTVIAPAATDPGGEFRFRPKDRFRIALKSRESRRRHAYLLHLTNDFGISLVHPVEVQTAEADSMVEPRKQLVIPGAFEMPDQAGRDIFLLIASDRPIDVSVLQQDGLRDAQQPLDPLGRLLRDSVQATRGAPASVAVGDWGVTMVTALTETTKK